MISASRTATRPSASTRPSSPCSAARSTWTTPSTSTGATSRSSPTVKPVAKHLHVAFYAPSHELVDAFHRAGVEAGYTDDGAPGPRPQYREDYYGGFLRDPDGNSVEAVYTGQERKTGAIDHLWLRTRDVAAIRRFYVATGHEIGVDEPDHVQIVTANASISYVAGEPLTEHVHIAFGADTNEAVDAFHRAAIDAGYTDNGAPGERAAYHPGYYGAFVLDPDGHNIEAVNPWRTLKPASQPGHR